MTRLNKRIKLLIIIYLAFISLGIPDGILGVAWPSMRSELNLPLEMMGILTVLLLFSSAFSSLVSPYLLNKIGVAKITFISCFITAFALGGYAVSSNFFFLILFTVPLGLGQGAVDSVLNNYVANHYSSKHMNWLHCFWGVGASFGPLIMTFCISRFHLWRTGYGTISAVQLLLTIILFWSIIKGVWDIDETNDKKETGKKISEKGLFSKISQGLAVLQFFLYTGLEYSMSVWISSVLVESRGISISYAGYISTAYYAAIMTGRFFSGSIVGKIGNMNMIRLGSLVAIAGGVVLNFTGGNYILNLFGTIIFGVGLAPLYPCLMHETPNRFKTKVSSKLIGYQVGAACLGGSVVSSGLGVVLSRYSLEALFFILVFLVLIYFIINEFLHKKYRAL